MGRVSLVQDLRSVSEQVSQEIGAEECAVARQEQDHAPPGARKEADTNDGGQHVADKDQRQELQDTGTGWLSRLRRVSRRGRRQPRQGPQKGQQCVPGQENEQIKRVGRHHSRHQQELKHQKPTQSFSSRPIALWGSGGGWRHTEEPVGDQRVQEIGHADQEVGNGQQTRCGR